MLQMSAGTCLLLIEELCMDQCGFRRIQDQSTQECWQGKLDSHFVVVWPTDSIKLRGEDKCHPLFFHKKKKENSVEDVQIKACEITSCILCICSLFCLQKLQKQFLQKEQKKTEENEIHATKPANLEGCVPVIVL